MGGEQIDRLSCVVCLGIGMRSMHEDVFHTFVFLAQRPASLTLCLNQFIEKVGGISEHLSLGVLLFHSWLAGSEHTCVQIRVLFFSCRYSLNSEG